MRVVRDILLFLAALYAGFILFMPKLQGYYYLEKFLNQKGVVIGNEEFKERVASLEIMHPVIYFQGQDLARVSKVKVTPLLFVNSLEADSLEFLNIAKQFLNVDIASLKAKETILKPFIIKIEAQGSFGKAKGEVDLKNRKIHIDIIEEKNIKPIKRFLKKGKKGWYYESKF